MKSFSFIATTLVAVFVAFAMSSCTNEELKGGQINDIDEQGVYVSFSVSMAAATRSTTTEEGGSTDGEEVGNSGENAISEIVLVLTNANYEYVTSTSISGANLSTVTGTTYVGKLSKSEIEDYLGTQVYVWVLCNSGLSFGEAGTSTFDMDMMYALSSTNALPSTSGSFLMANASAYVTTLPSDLTGYSESQPYNLGNIYVERAVARFDFRDGSGNNFTYTISPATTESGEVVYAADGEGNNVTISATIVGMSLINQSQNFYYFRRVSDNGLAGGTNFAYCGTEYYSGSYNDTTGETTYTYNYVVDTDAAVKYAYDAYTDAQLAAYFSNHLTLGVSGWTFDAPATVVTGTSDASGDYAIWCYAAENTIPQDATGYDELQVNGISTGVVFRAEVTVTAEEGSALAADIAAGETIYEYDGVYYGSWETVQANSTTALEAAEVEAEIEALGTSATQAEIYAIYKSQGFTWLEYDADLGGYYTYYYYWNRHNDNNVADLMGPMEFAVVRNNVYKLSVSSITGLGRSSLDIPEIPDPDEPKTDLNIVVDVTILPWVVRQNDIVF